MSSAFAGYVKIFGHNTAGGLFSSKDDALSKNPEDQNANLFSILDQLEKYRDENGNFQFKLCYPELDKCNEWIQSSNPAKDTDIKGFRAIALTFETNGIGGRWAGLGKNIFSEALMDDSPSHSYYWCAIGALSYWPSQPKIAGPLGLGSVTEVDLYVLT